MANVVGGGGIDQFGAPGSFTYAPVAGREDKPVNFVSFYDALRFANWMHNGSPIGPQGNATTEDGAYTITDDGITNNSIQRNPDADFFLTSEDEWYKAAYYNPVNMAYWPYPAHHSDPVVCSAPTATPNTANCGFQALDVTDVESYSNSSSPWGTYDQAGNVSEWTEAIVSGTRVHRGGGYIFGAGNAAASLRTSVLPASAGGNLGFRMVPEPSAACTLALGVAAMAALGRRRARRSSSGARRTASTPGEPHPVLP